MPARFFAPDAHGPGEVVVLPDEEAQHLTRVLRLSTGARVAVFNGRGDEYDAEVETAARDGVSVRLGARRDPAPEARLSVTLGQAVLKGDKMDQVVRDAVMIGVAAIQPIVTMRAEQSLATLERSHRRERWARVAVSAAKQCGRAVVPPIGEPLSLEAFLDSLQHAWLSGPALMLVEPGASGSGVALAEIDVGTPKAATLVVGPEGGWAPEEIEQASAACRLVVIGQRTLRAETAALVAVAALYARWGEF